MEDDELTYKVLGLLKCGSLNLETISGLSEQTKRLVKDCTDIVEELKLSDNLLTLTRVSSGDLEQIISSDLLSSE